MRPRRRCERSSRAGTRAPASPCRTLPPPLTGSSRGCRPRRRPRAPPWRPGCAGRDGRMGRLVGWLAGCWVDRCSSCACTLLHSPTGLFLLCACLPTPAAGRASAAGRAGGAGAGACRPRAARHWPDGCAKEHQAEEGVRERVCVQVAAHGLPMSLLFALAVACKDKHSAGGAGSGGSGSGRRNSGACLALHSAQVAASSSALLITLPGLSQQGPASQGAKRPALGCRSADHPCVGEPSCSISAMPCSAWKSRAGPQVAPGLN